MTVNKVNLDARDGTLPLSNDTKQSSIDARTQDQAARLQKEDPSIVDSKHDKKIKLQAKDIAPSLNTGSMPAAAVSAVMGPPPPEETQKMSRWELWRRDRREARDLGAPSNESSRRWKVGNVVS